ncbi:ubiquitin related modifier 1 [Lojkania enalia]|uniref:Ubiquitin-related modifier 1 n=1 Tax=Lojkania enalia TaxID=147567 RepID=A0A9P4NAT4_9PLEO|nr:ubiquitin related modifier 1 [Didymosphaeria enalia]
MGNIKFSVEFSGGLQDLFGQKKIPIPSDKNEDQIQLPKLLPGESLKLKHVIDGLAAKLKGRNAKLKLFVQGDKGFYEVTPGILVLINDSDWELEGEYEYEIQSGDQVLFVSTLHGG